METHFTTLLPSILAHGSQHVQLKWSKQQKH